MQIRSSLKLGFVGWALPFWRPSPFLLLCAGLLFAKDAPPTQSKTTFEKAQSSASPSKQDLQACIQAQDEELPKAKKSDRSELHYRKGYCKLLEALLTRDHLQFEDAEKELGIAGDSTRDEPARITDALYSIGRFADERSTQPQDKKTQELEEAVSQADCAKSGYVGKPMCESVISAARLWLGWQALRADKLGDARKYFDRVPASPWSLWLAGISAFEGKQWPEAATAMQKAIDAWSIPEKSAKSSADLLAPKPDRGGLYARLGSAHFMAGNFAAAIPALDIAIKEHPSDAYSAFVRARARENLGNRQEALADYELAANAASTRPAGHFYRGVLLLRRNNLRPALQEFAFAQNLPPGDLPQTDIPAWRALVQARADGCKTPVSQMEAALAAASVVFPKKELEDFEFDCRVQKATTLKELLALDAAMRKRYGGPGSEDARKRIAESYTKQALLAEEQAEPEVAASAYRKAIEWEPKATKARFNLAAIYIEEKKFDLAEKEYRALLAADPADHEAQYWLAESILSQDPDAERKAAACVVLKEALKTNDPEKRSLSTALSLMANCQK